MQKIYFSVFILTLLSLFVITACVQATSTVSLALPSQTSVSATATNTSVPLPTETVIPTPTLGVGSTLVGKDGMTLLYVPSGEFVMGSNDGEANEKPVHTVYLDTFWIDQTEVTNKQYQACVGAGACKPPAFTTSYIQKSDCYGKSCIYPHEYYGNAEYEDYPVIYVNWD